MAKEIKLPKFDQAMEQGVILNCLVQPGQKVSKGDCLFEIEMDKVTLQIESPDEGFVKAILAQPEQTVSVGTTVLILGEENEEIDLNACKNIPAEKKDADKSSCNNFPDSAGAITPEKMLQSKRQIPCFYLNVTVDVTELAEYRQKLNETGDIKITIDDFLIRALAIGFEKWPVMTGKFEGDSIRLSDAPGIGLVTASKNQTVAPVIKNVTKKNLAQIAADRTAIINRAAACKLTDEDLSGGCLTVENLGHLNIDSYIPIVIPGQCSILGVGKITDACISEKENLVVHKLMKMTLAVDHKVANGAEAAQFLSCVAKLLEDPQKLI